MLLRTSRLLIALSLLLAACLPAATPTPQVILLSTATLPPAATALPSPIPTPPPTAPPPPPKALTICTGAEPGSLFPYGTSMYVASLIKQAIVDGGLSAGHARALLSAPPERQLEIFEVALRKELSVRELEQL
ncbi:MAG: hypothetical protein HY784_17100, partial [Chloroflexi bacterium]|nr:hypothetical protein [Chloroflexota bacterium]